MLKIESKDRNLFMQDITHLLYNVVYDGFKIHGFYIRETILWIGTR